MEVGKRKILVCLPSVAVRHSAHELVCRVLALALGKQLYVPSGRPGTRHNTNRIFQILSSCVSCRLEGLGRLSVLFVPSVEDDGHSAKSWYAECLMCAECGGFRALGKRASCRVPYGCRVLLLRHSTQSTFVECPTFSTRHIYCFP